MPKRARAASTRTRAVGTGDAPPRVRIGFAPEAHAQFDALSQKERDGLLRKIKEVVLHPALAKPLTGPLSRCCRVTYGRLRCVVRIADRVAVALVLVVAPRKQGAKGDPYDRAVSLLRSAPSDMDRLLAQYVRAFLEQGAHRLRQERNRR